MAKKKDEKDQRYKVVNIMIQEGAVKSFKDIFTYMPKSVISKALGKNNNRMGELIEEPTGFTFAEIITIAKLIEVDFAVVAGLIVKPGRSKIKQSKRNPEA
jgi:hypothetical protein